MGRVGLEFRVKGFWDLAPAYLVVESRKIHDPRHLPGEPSMLDSVQDGFESCVG